MTDTQHSTLNNRCIWLGIPGRIIWILPHFKILYSNTWIWCWSLKCRVLINRHKFRGWTQNLWWILRILHSWFTLHTQDSPIQIHWVLSVECWVSVISLEPDFHFCCICWSNPGCSTVTIKQSELTAEVRNDFFKSDYLSASTTSIRELFHLMKKNNHFI